MLSAGPFAAARDVVCRLPCARTGVNFPEPLCFVLRTRFVRMALPCPPLEKVPTARHHMPSPEPLYDTLDLCRGTAYCRNKPHATPARCRPPFPPSRPEDECTVIDPTPTFSRSSSSFWGNPAARPARKAWDLPRGDSPAVTLDPILPPGEGSYPT
jgi:hypothetical protein